MAEFVPVEPFDFIIFGGTGDLARRKLLPALFHRDRDAQFSADSRIIALSRGQRSREAYQAWVRDAVTDTLDEPPNDSVWQRFVERLDYLSLDIESADHWQQLAVLLGESNARTRVFYLATGPELFGPVAHNIEAAGLYAPSARIVLEKPLGHDHDSACRINDAVGAVFAERQIYRIDHYLGKETVQNLLALRFGNSLFEPLWRRGSIDHVQITVAEDLGVGNRLDFYEQTGALRDMVQNHVLQLLCLVAMEAPASMHHDDIRNEKIKVLRSLRPITPADADRTTVRGQYTAGVVDSQSVPGYASEQGGASQSGAHKPRAETFVALKAEIDNWRWRGTPFYLRSGKRLARKSSQIVFQFTPVPHSIFGDEPLQANRLTLSLQPEEGVQLTLMTKEPGPGGFRMRSLPLNLSFPDAFALQYPDAYERLLMEILRGNPALFMRRDEVEASWAWIDRIIDSWRAVAAPLHNYMAGSWGPAEASLLVDRDQRRWCNHE